MSSSMSSSSLSIGVRHNLHFHHTSIRVSDPERSLHFYQNNFGMKHLHTYHFSSSKFSLYFLIIPRENEKLPTINTKESEKYLWNIDHTSVLELTHNHSTEDDKKDSKEIVMNNGNVEPYRGFGHIAFNTFSVHDSVQTMLKNGVKFQKLPSQGTMMNIAFALDPDGYWIEIVNRTSSPSHPPSYTINPFSMIPYVPTLLSSPSSSEPLNFSQTMIRVKDPLRSLYFYRDLLGMILVRIIHYTDFSLYFLTSIHTSLRSSIPNPSFITEEDEEAKTSGSLPLHLPPELRQSSPAESGTFVKNLWRPVLELTHNHGTETKKEFKYHNGNDYPQGFGHVAFTCDDLKKTVKDISEEMPEIAFRKRPEEGEIHDIAFLYDPDGYSVELVDRNMSL